MKNIILPIVLLVFTFATFIRVYQLDKVPSSLFGDEVDVGYQAYSLLKSGKDLNGNSWPILLQSLSEYRAPLFIYSAIPFVSLFGLNEYGVRLPAAFWGILSIMGIFLLSRKLWGDRVAIISTFFLSFSSWHIQYSRASFEVTMLLSVIVFATYFFVKSFNKRYFLIFSALLFGLTPYIYSTAVVFVPLLILLLVILYTNKLKEIPKILIISAITLILTLVPYSYQTLSGKAGERFGLVSIFTDQVLKDKVSLAQKAGISNSTIERIFHNKPLIWLQVFTLNYLRAFSPEFLFLNGDPNFRHSVHEMGQLYYLDLILLIMGIYYIIKFGTEQKGLLVGWFLIAPIPAALTADGGFHATRTFMMLVPLGILVGIGGRYILENIKKFAFKTILMIVFFLGVINISFYLHRYFLHYPVESWSAWQYGFKQTMQYISENQTLYDRILINNSYEPSLIRFLFWTKYDPNLFHQNFRDDKPINNIILGFDGFNLENKYYFGTLNQPFEQIIDTKTLLIASARDEITNPETLKDGRVKLLKIIYSPNNIPIFYIITGTRI